MSVCLSFCHSVRVCLRISLCCVTGSRFTDAKLASNKLSDVYDWESLLQCKVNFHFVSQLQKAQKLDVILGPQWLKSTRAVRVVAMDFSSGGGLEIRGRRQVKSERSRAG